MRTTGLILALCLAACGGSAGKIDAALGGGDGGGPDGGVTIDAPPGGPDATMYQYNDAGCLTFQSASQICGFNSDGTICMFSSTCPGGGGDPGQCMINCEMGAQFSKCYQPADVDCLKNAVSSMSCSALAACMWVL